MENASKALLIAGGMLLAMTILVLLVTTVSNISSMAENQENMQIEKQIVEFNQGYLAYNKSIMYGVEVITVVNKAIDYNKRIGLDEEEYRINIILELNQNFDRTKETIIQLRNGTVEYKPIESMAEGTLKIGTYQLFQRDDSTQINEDVINFFNQKPDDKIDQVRGTTIITTYEYSAITNFKTAIFKCENVGYSNTGRVNSMTFTQI